MKWGHILTTSSTRASTDWFSFWGGKRAMPYLLIHSRRRISTRGPKLPPKRVLHRVRASASSFIFQYSLASLRSSRICLRLLPRLPFNSILRPTFPSITCFRRQFLCNMRPIQIALLLCILWNMFLSSLTLCIITSSLLFVKDTLTL